MANEEVIEFIRYHADDDTYQLALHKKLYPQLSDEDMAFALQQIESRRKAKNKLPSFYNNPDILYPPRLAMEQCSSEITASYKASLLAEICSPALTDNKSSPPATLADLTGGFGIDTLHFSRQCQTTYYIESNTVLYEIASHNFNILNANITTQNTQAEDFLKTTKHLDWIYIDPSRRNNAGRKVFRLQDCEPNLLELWDLIQEKSSFQMVKLSPMVDIKLIINSPLLPQEIHIIALNNECKEVLCVCKSSHKRKTDNCNTVISSVNIRNSKTNYPANISKFIFLQSEEEQAVATYTDRINSYLYEPNVAILKAGGYKLVSNKYGIDKLAPNSHLYTSDRLISEFQGRIFKVHALNPDPKTIRGTQANIISRNYPLSAEAIKNKYRIKDGGNNYLIATTAGNHKVIIKCSEVIS